jgi:hypothetical protein
MVRLISGAQQHREAAACRGPVVARAHLVCAECRYARLSSVQPRALCTRRGAAFEGRLVFSGQPACEGICPRGNDERTRAWCTLQSASEGLRFAQVRPHLY